MKYRKKPVVIEAFKWTGGPGHNDYPEWLLSLLAMNRARIYPGIQHGFDVIPAHMIIDTLEGKMRAEAGDYIIKGVKGEIYPCKPDIFEATYQLANAEPTGAEMITAERASHTWTPQHDDTHSDGSLRVNAAILACVGTDAGVLDHNDNRMAWGLEYTDTIKRLAVAGSLIAAEIDRLKRLNALSQ